MMSVPIQPVKTLLFLFIMLPPDVFTDSHGSGTLETVDTKHGVINISPGTVLDECSGLVLVGMNGLRVLLVTCSG